MKPGWVVRCLLLAALWTGGGMGRLAALTVTEIHYHPREGGRDLEFVELHNETADPLDLSGYRFSRGIDFVFPDRTYLEPYGYLVLCANEEAVRNTYGIDNTIGDWSSETNLDNGGETLEFLNSAGAVIFSFRYNDRGRWPTAADGTGHSLESLSPWKDPGRATSWAASGSPGGSPGQPNEPAPASAVVLNEVLASGETPWVELYNRGSEPVDVSGYHLTTERGDLTQATLPQGATVPPRGWFSVAASDLGLAIVAEDGRLFVALSEPGGARVLDAHIFEPLEDLRSGARLPDGGAFLSENAPATRDAPNTVDVPRVVINELYYHPLEQAGQTEEEARSSEFVELHNPTAEPVALSGWRFSDGIRFEFPVDAVLPGGGYLVIGIDPERLRKRYGLSASEVVGPLTAEARDDFGGLANGGERVTLRDDRDNIVDTVRYDDGGEWPSWADGLGSSLELVDVSHDNASPQNWDASDDSAEAPITNVSYSGPFTGGEEELHFVLQSAGITLVDDVHMVGLTTRIEPRFSLTEFGDVWKYTDGIDDPSTPIEAWRQEGFDDSGWLAGPTPIGFGDTDIATEILNMRRNYSATFFRHEFDVPDLSAVEGLFLEVDYDDGFAAYLNGVDVGSSNLADRGTMATAVTLKEEVLILDLTEHKSLLKEGANLLAVQVHNVTLRSTDFRFQARLFSGELFVEDSPNLITDGTFETQDTAVSWVSQGTHVRSGRTEEGALSGTGSFKLVASSRGDNKVNRVETSNEGLGGLFRGQQHTISFSARWVIGSPTLLTHGTYNGTNDPNYAHATTLNLPQTFGTPGAVNSVVERRLAAVGHTNLGPAIADVSHSPILPLDGETVTVRARIRDPDGVASAEVVYSVGVPLADGEEGLMRQPLTDPDGDGVYVAEIPPQEAGRAVVFCIRALDGGGREGRFPANHLERTHPVILDVADASPSDHRHLLYRHEPPPAPVEPEPPPEAEPAPMPEPVPEAMPEPPPYPPYRFWIDEATDAYIDGRMRLSNDLVDGTFILDGDENYYRARLRFTGSPFARGGWGGSYRIELPKDALLQGAIEKFNLEQHQGAGGLDARERISSYLLRYSQGETKVPFLRHWLVDWELPSRVAGPREHVMAPNREFIRRWYPEDGDGLLFEMDDRHTINDGGGRSGSTDGRVRAPPYGPPESARDKEYFRYFFNPRAGNAVDEWEPFVDFADLLGVNTTSADEFGERVWDEIDVEEFCRIWAIRLNTDDWDHWGGRRGKNCYFYLPSNDGRWVFLSWDLELTYGDVNAFRPPALDLDSADLPYGLPFDEAERFLNHPPIKRLYYRVLEELIDGPFQSGFLTEYLEMLAAVGMQRTEVGLADGYIDQRRALLREVVSGVTSGSVAFTVVDGEGNVVADTLTVPTGSEILLGGHAPVEVTRIEAVVDGVPQPDFAASFGGTSMLSWGGGLPAVEEPAPLRLVGFDRFGEVVESLAITLVPEAPPQERLFVRGDVDRSGVLEITDPIRTVGGIFGDETLPCGDAADTNDDGRLDLTDVLLSLEFQFLPGQVPPSPPFPDPGTDPTADGLDCSR